MRITICVVLSILMAVCFIIGTKYPDLTTQEKYYQVGFLDGVESAFYYLMSGDTQMDNSLKRYYRYSWNVGNREITVPGRPTALEVKED